MEEEMKIEKIQYEQNKGIFLFTIGKVDFWISYDKYIAWSYHQGDEINEAMLEKIEKEDSRNRAFAIGERYAAYKPRTVYEVKRKLQLYEIDEEHIKEVIEKLKKLRFLDDDAYARRYAQEMYANRTWSRYQLYAKLMEKGIAKELISNNVDAISDSMEKEKVVNLLEKKYSRRDYDNPKENNKVIQALMRRGFSSSVVKLALKEFLLDWSKNESE